MLSDNKSVWQSPAPRQLVDVLVSIDSAPLMRSFLRDVMSEKEIVEISSRLEAARMLESGSTYNEIVAQTKLSSRTIARISDWMKNGCGGYAAVLDLINHHNHIPPVSAE
jgi:TrpR-related protein YerC/YecD